MATLPNPRITVPVGANPPRDGAGHAHGADIAPHLQLMGRWAFVEEIALADCALDVEGTSLDDLFETAARALAEVMVDPATVRTQVRRTITLEATALDLLLYDWLSELIFRKDRDGEVFTKHDGGPWARTAVAALVADVEGGAIEPGAHGPPCRPEGGDPARSSPSERTAGGWRARVVIDI